MRFITLVGGVLASLVLATASQAAQIGKDYALVNPAQPTEAGTKIEVVEAFSYACPHCAELEPLLNAWAKKLPDDVVLRRIPVTFGREAWVGLARTYYALEAIGSIDKLHGKIFEAMHAENVILTNQETLFDWVAKQGVDRKKFIDAYNSFGVQSKVQRAVQLTRAYGIDGVPTLIVNGKFRTSGSMTGTHEKMFAVADELIAAERKQPLADAARSLQ